MFKSIARAGIGQTRKSGFTLIELLVVIAIIGLLSSILFPVFSRARENGRRASCISNLKQLAMAFSQYCQDYDGWLPGATVGGPPLEPIINGVDREGGWVFYSTFGTGTLDADFDVSRGSIFSYTRNAQIYICPSDSRGRRTGNSYAFNSCMTDPESLSNGGGGGRKEGSFKEPSRWLLLGEEEAVGGSTNDGFLLKTDDPDADDPISERHSAGSNVAFLDGHVKWHPVQSIRGQRFQTGGADFAVCLEP